MDAPGRASVVARGADLGRFGGARPGGGRPGGKRLGGLAGDGLVPVCPTAAFLPLLPFLGVVLPVLKEAFSSTMLKGDR
jgi:hypothetical protein